MKIVAVTGGIASGKSTVINILKEMNCAIIDADKIAYDVVKRGKLAWQKIVDYFGSDILLLNEEINRKKLGLIIFNDEKKRIALNNIVHPIVINEINRQIKELQDSSYDLIIVDVPLLYESNMEKMFDCVWVVWVPFDIQVERLMKRNNFTYEGALSRINSQMPLDEKCHKTKYVIDNSGSIEETIAQVVKLRREMI